MKKKYKLQSENDIPTATARITANYETWKEDKIIRTE